MLSSFKIMEKTASEQGFTLIELAIVILVSGLLLSGIISAYEGYTKARTQTVTLDNLDMARGALGQFYTRHGRLPCPAPPGLPPEDTRTGREFCAPADNPSPGKCLEDGFCRQNGMDADLNSEEDTILKGALPYITLNLNSAYALDGWQRQFVYVVTENITSRDMFSEDLGAIQLVKADGKTSVGTGKGLQAIVFSSGDNGKGAYLSSGALYLPCEGKGVDIRNCDHDGAYVSDVLSIGNPQSYFDDIVAAQIRTTFDLWPAIHGTCPEGEFAFGVDTTGAILCRVP